MITLKEKQWMFSQMVARLIINMKEAGYEVSIGYALRDPDSTVGKLGSRSCHASKLAIDLNLFKDGKYLSSTEDHRRFGEMWESWGGSWGGRFKCGDGNHYSIEHNGVR